MEPKKKIDERTKPDASRQIWRRPDLKKIDLSQTMNSEGSGGDGFVVST